MDTHTYINKTLSDMQTSYCNDEQLSDALSALGQQINKAQSASYTREDLEELIKGEFDALEQSGVDEDSELWSDIRNLQDVVIGFYAEDVEA